MRMISLGIARCTTLALLALAAAGCGGGGGGGGTVSPATTPTSLGARPAGSGDNLPPSLSGPSTAWVAESATFSGSGLPPNAATSISVVAPDGSEAHYSAATGPDGSLSHSLTPKIPGAYTIKVLDAAGRVIVTQTLNAGG